MVETLYLALRHPKLINQYGVSDSAEDCDFGILTSTYDGCHGPHRMFLITDMGEPNLPHVIAPAKARGSDEKHVAT